MKIVILDGATVNPGDLSWPAPLNDKTICTIYDYTSPEEVIPRAKDAEFILLNKIHMTRTIMEELPKLKHIFELATGTDNIDLQAAKELGITVHNVPAYSTDSVVQHVFALLLQITQHLTLHLEKVKSGEWSRSSTFSYYRKPMTELSGKTLGLIAFGRIAQAVAKIALQFNMNVIAYDYKNRPSSIPNIKMASLETLFKTADIISLHCPLNDSTKQMINQKTLALMKPSTILINTARGDLINEADLAKALNQEKIQAASLDVLSTEPPKPDNPLLTTKNCFITPHLAWATKEARERLIHITVENLRKALITK